MAGAEADRPHKRGTGDAYAREVGRSRPAVGDVPVDLERLGEEVAEEAEAGHLHRIAIAGRFDFKNLDLEEVTRLGARDVDRPGERVHDIEVGRSDGLQRDVRTHLPVKCIAGFEDDLVAGLTVHDRWDVGVPAIVAGVRFIAERLAPVDSNLVDIHATSLTLKLIMAANAHRRQGRRKRSPRAGAVDMLRSVFGAAEPELSPLDPAAAARTAVVRAAIDPSQLRRSLETLPAPRARLLDPEAMATVDALSLDSFRSAGWSAELRAFEEPASDGADGTPDLAPGLRLSGVNIVAIKNGESRDAVVVVAHHDTVPETGGADDNGSGVIALMELAQLLESRQLRRSIVLAAVEHEELGFWGTRRLVRDLSAERHVVGAFVFEMLAYADSTPGSQRLPKGIGTVYRDQVRKLRVRDFRGDFMAVIYQESARRLATCFAECLDLPAGPDATILLRAPSDLPVIGPLLARTVPFVRDFARSDHVPFWEAGVPAVQITDTANFRNPHYHRPSDTPGTLDYDRLADVIAAATVAVERLAAQ